MVERIVTMVRERIPARFKLDPFRDVQVLSPMNKSELGVLNLNKVLQEALNPQQDRNQEVARFGTTFRRGDKVIQTQNNYQREVFNGDIGRITDVDAVDQTLSVDYDGRDVEYDFGDLDELQLAYCTSIHKAQGSEYPAVVIPVHTQHFVMLQRNLLYTGITRGRKLVVLVGSRKALWIAVNKADQARRNSLLHWRLRQGAGKPAGAWITQNACCSANPAHASCFGSAPMDEEAAFLEGVVSAPRNHLPRLVYADWLDEQGRPDQAEYLRLLCQATKRSRHSVANRNGSESCGRCSTGHGFGRVKRGLHELASQGELLDAAWGAFSRHRLGYHAWAGRTQPQRAG